MICVVMTFIVIGLIVRYKRLKVIKAGSPIFLTVTLLGCVAMYMEVSNAAALQSKGRKVYVAFD